MKALVFNGPRDIRYESFADPELLTHNSVILKVTKCSICGSDLHMYHGETLGGAPYTADTPKFCTGHEFIGEVVEAGKDVRTFKVGDKALAAGGAGCGKCVACLTGGPMKCANVHVFGIGPELQGGQAEYVCVPNADTVMLNTQGELSDEHALLLTDAMTTAYFGVTRADIKPGGNVVVVGLGPIGLIGVELALLLGAARVFALDPVASRRAMAEKLGAVAFDPTNDGVAHVLEATNGRGAESVFEASGASAAIASVLPLTAWGGTASFIGIPQPRDQLSMRLIMMKNITVRGGICQVTQTWPQLMPLLQQGRLKTAGLFSHHFKLSEGAEAFRLFDSRDEGVIKIMVDVD